MKDDITVKHESFGLLSFSRRQSNIGKHLFGSSIKHRNTVVMKVNVAEENRGLNRYWYFPKETIIEVEMSYSQFAEAIMAIDTQGVPTTIRRVEGKRMEECPGESQRELFEKEFKEKVLDVTQRLQEMKNVADNLLNKKGTMKVSEKKEIAHILHMMVMEVRSNLPFIQKSYNEAMDKTTHEAKTEIEAFMQHAVITLGLEEFKKLNGGIIEIADNGGDDEEN